MRQGMKQVCVSGLVVLALLLVAGCALQPQYAPLEQVGFHQQLPLHEGRTLVLFEPVFPGKPLRETVWDNVEGPRWLPFEAGRASWVPGVDIKTRVEGPPVSQNRLEAGAQVTHRLTVPFGAIITAKYKQAFDRSYPGWRVCEEEQCLQTYSKLMDFDRVIRIHIDRFDIWEQPSGYVNLYLHSTWTETTDNGLKTRTVTYEKERLQVALPGIAGGYNGKAEQLLRLTEDFADEAVFRHMQPKAQRQPAADQPSSDKPTVAK